jgi:glutamate/tyrosine decarboxylase-like PLP-dependent enzyme
MRTLGRHGVAELVDRCCDLAARFAEGVDGRAGLRVGNDVVLNQVVVDAGEPERSRALIDAIQAEGTCWVGPTTWHGRDGFRVSVSNWSTTADDIDRSVDAVLTVAGRH